MIDKETADKMLGMHLDELEQFIAAREASTGKLEYTPMPPDYTPEEDISLDELT